MTAIQEIRVHDRGETDTKVYEFEGISETEAETLRREVLTDPITQVSTLNAMPIDESVRIGYKPGVTDPMEDTLKRVSGAPHVATYQEYMSGSEIPKPSQVLGYITGGLTTLAYEGHRPSAEEVETIEITALETTQFEKISRERSLFLNGDEMKAIADYFKKMGREPTDIELETFAQTWSEHNGHKTFKAKLIDADGNEHEPFIVRIKKTSEKFFDQVGVVTAFKDNAGGMRFYDGYAIIGKWETHNSPVAIEPFGGAATKNGGVYRDIMGTGLGGVNLVGLMINNLADPDTRPEDVPPGCLHPKHILFENSRGERDYGNNMGIPTHGISLHFHPDFVAKPTSMGGVIGCIPEEFCQKKEPNPGDLLITVGGRTGRDGIHGATFSSGEMTRETKSIHATAVQLGNPIEQKRMADALIAARDAGLIRAITDCGGGGLSSAVGEMGERVGVSIDLDKVPLKYQGLLPWEIWLSESQERMVVTIDPKHWDAFQKICAGFDVPVTAIGEFTGTKKLNLRYDGMLVGQLDMDFLHSQPKRTLIMAEKEQKEQSEVPNYPDNIVNTWKRVLSHWNVCSTEVMHRQYDTSVQARTVLFPFTGTYQDAPNDASVVKPLYDKPYGVVVAGGSNPVLNVFDPYWGSVWAVTKALSNFVSVGGNPKEAAVIDNFVTPYPDAETLGDIDHMVDALTDMMNVMKVPCVSGKDSLSSTYRFPDRSTLKIPPVLHLTVFGKIPDIEKTVTSDIKSTDSTLVLVGRMDADTMGGSVYFDTKRVNNTFIPRVNLYELPQTLGTVYEAIQTGKVKSCHAIHEGGLATTIAQMCFGGDCGAVINLKGVGNARPDFLLFNETTGCFVVEVANKKVAEELFSEVPHAILGKTTRNKEITVLDHDVLIGIADLYDLKDAWQKPMKELYGDTG